MDIKKFEEKVNLCLQKLNRDTDLDWSEIVGELGLDCSADHLRKLSYAYKEYNDYIQQKGLNSISMEMKQKLNEQLIEIKKQKVQLSDLRTEVNKQSRHQARYEQLLEAVKYSAEKISKNNPFYNNNFKCSIESNNRREIIVALADIHYGLSVNDNWNMYNSDIAIRRINKIINKAIEIGDLHKCKVAHLLVCGDIINNNIHLTTRLSNRENVTSQIVGVSELLSNAILKLSSKFNYVVVHLTSGNHDRIIPKKEDNDYEDTFINVVKEFVKIRTSQLSNVILDSNEFGHDIVKFNVCGKAIIGTHGDKIPNNQAITRFSTMFGRVDYVIQGHYHHTTVNSIGNSKVLTIGSFSGSDRYSREKGLICRPTQTILVLENNSNDEVIYEIDLSD